ncbi:MAG TPA: ChaN family lipoprotein [Geminicoccaceae bacterium]|nr:ChaN family lipoprotein [Geminicoccaceae bacterium]
MRTRRESGSNARAGLRRALVAASALLAAACAPGAWKHGAGRDHPLVGKIYQVSSERFVDQAMLLANLARADFVLIGERHDNRDHHRLQALLTRELQAASARPRVVAFEMIPSDRQLAVVEHLQTRPKDAAGLGAAVDWPALGWPDWPLYQPIAEAALAAGATIVAADLAPAQRDAVFSEGPEVLQASMVRRTGLDRDLPAPLGASLAQELREAHCGQVSEPLVEGMFRVQRARDAMMADRLATVAGRAGGVLIAGNGHVRSDRGVPWYLARLRPTARTLSVGLLEVQDEATTVPADLPFDYVWFTPRVDDADPCADAAALPHHAPAAAQRAPRRRRPRVSRRAGASPRAGARAGSARCSRWAVAAP